MSSRIKEILKAGSQVTPQAQYESFKITLPKFLDAKEPTLQLPYDVLMSIAFELGCSHDFNATRSFRMILEQVKNPEWVQTLEDSFRQYRDIQNIDLNNLQRL